MRRPAPSPPQRRQSRLRHSRQRVLRPFLSASILTFIRCFGIREHPFVGALAGPLFLGFYILTGKDRMGAGVFILVHTKLIDVLQEDDRIHRCDSVGVGLFADY
jgi:hypothetical protein